MRLSSVEAVPPKPEDFAGAYGLTGQAGSLLRLELPAEVFMGAERPDLGDLRIFDAERGSSVETSFAGTASGPSHGFGAVRTEAPADKRGSRLRGMGPLGRPDSRGDTPLVPGLCDSPVNAKLAACRI
ncbi:MAG: DUF3999 domain-containing protein [Treponema sp.]|nr:DUF3999 domain-containing protein [Treponema sp.]